MKSRLIVNPVSGTDQAADHLRQINEGLRDGVGDMDIVMTVGPGDAQRAGEQAAADGYERLFVAGGDGTLNEVLNGVAQVEGALARILFSIIPQGTGNDFARSIGVPEDIVSALDVALDGAPLAVDVGVLNSRHFVNASAGGFIAEVSDAVNPELKTLAGRLAYLVGGAQVLGDYEPPEARVRIVQENGTFERTLRLQMFAACNARMIGGGRLIAPHAIVDDGWLDVCLVEAMPTLEFIALLLRVNAGEHVNDERVLYFQARELEIDLDEDTKVNTDGEVLETDACRYGILPRVARFTAGETACCTLARSSVPGEAIAPAGVS
jgi:diacylglycerol kinase (ATP)